MSRDTYVGPYVRCVTRTETRTRSRKTCTYEPCRNYGHSNMPGEYCSRCGRPFGPLVYTVTENVPNKDQVEEVLGIDVLVTPYEDSGYYNWAKTNNVHIWLSNMPYEGQPPRTEEYVFTVRDITYNEITAERLAFMEAYAVELAKLKMLYGDTAVTVCWGVIGN